MAHQTMEKRKNFEDVSHLSLKEARDGEPSSTLFFVACIRGSANILRTAREEEKFLSLKTIKIRLNSALEKVFIKRSVSFVAVITHVKQR